MNDQPAKWLQALDERQQKEIAFAILYARDFHHGTTGHNSLMILARLAVLLDELEALGADVDTALARLNESHAAKQT